VAGQTEHEAFQNFLNPLQLALSCVSNAVLHRTTYDPHVQPHVLILNQNTPVRIDSGRGIALYVAHHFRIIEADDPRGPWKVSTAGYAYALGDRDGREIIAFHWHPSSPNKVTSPHLHLGPVAQVGHDQLRGAHIPTGRIALEDVLRLAIAEFGAPARRADWDDVLRTTKAAFTDWRTWG
jgi:hypothetical protein